MDRLKPIPGLEEEPSEHGACLAHSPHWFDSLGTTDGPLSTEPAGSNLQILLAQPNRTRKCQLWLILSKATRLEELLFQLILGSNCQELRATMRKCGVDRRCCESMSVAD